MDEEKIRTEYQCGYYTLLQIMDVYDLTLEEALRITRPIRDDTRTAMDAIELLRMGRLGDIFIIAGEMESARG